MDILSKKRVRFTQPAALNDPFELLPVFDTLASAAELEAEVRIEGDPVERSIRERYRRLPQAVRLKLPYEVVARQLREKVEAAGLDKLLNPIAAKMLDEARPLILASLQNDIGILSLTESSENMVMWAHYADDHAGLLFEFNSEHAWFSRARSPQDECYGLRRVRYLDRAASVETFRNLDNSVLFTKRPEWAYEEEWRMLAPVTESVEVHDTGTDRIYLFDIDPASLRRVVVGARASPDVASVVVALISEDEALWHVEVQKSVIDPVRPTLRYEVLLRG